MRTTWRTWACTLALFLLIIPVGAAAKVCGDDINGQAVPCACGDIVGSNLTLSDDHPVVHATCDFNGLVIRTSTASPGITLDLHGYTVRGSGRSVGVLVLSGGQGGAHILSSNGRGTISGFADGISSRGNQTASIESILLTQNHRDAISVEGNGYEIRDTEARDSGRDGFSLSGRGYHLQATQATGSKRFGYLVRGQAATLGAPNAGSTSDGSGQAGFSLQGPGHHLIDCTATGSAKTGVLLHGSHYEISGCTVTRNKEDGIKGMGTDWKLRGNVASNNGNHGLVVRGAGVTDLGGNRGTSNRGQHSHRHGVQCEINQAPCKP